MKDIIIHNWDELQAHIFENVWEDSIRRYRADFIYRGTAEKEWGMIPSLNRVLSHNLALEQTVLRAFRKYGYADLAGNASFWQILALAQHYGLPTRLLDWTYSPLVAAHFATEDISKYDCDGAIWCVDIREVNRQLPESLKQQLSRALSNTFTADMLDQSFGDLCEMSAISDKPYALFFEPSSMVDRIANQYSLFSVVSDSGVILSDILEQNGCGCFRMIIPKEVKLEIRDKLDYINISERMIYPGLAGISKWIARRYADLGPKYNRREGETKD